MDERQALHTAARRACIDRAAPWDRLAEQLREARVWKDPRWEEIPWARQAMVAAILRGVERLVPEEFADAEALRAALLQAGRGPRCSSRSPRRRRACARWPRSVSATWRPSRG